MISITQAQAVFDEVFMEAGGAAGSALGDGPVASGHAVVSAGEVITTEAGFLRGHGTYVDGSGRLLASVNGVVERVNKLISVRPLKSRYTGEIGDVIVGRVTDVGQKRWKVDINAYQDAVLMLSSVNLTGGALRRRTMEDQLQMREYYDVSDLVSAEVQQFFGDGTMSIHTRSLKFGKLENGQLATVPPTLVKRLKQHFVSLRCGVDLIVGCNGYIWIQQSEQLTAEEKQEEDVGQGSGARNAEGMQRRRQRHAGREIGYEARRNIARVANAIRILSEAFVAISPETIMDIVDASAAVDMPPHVMNDPANRVLLVQPAADRVAGALS